MLYLCICSFTFLAGVSPENDNISNIISDRRAANYAAITHRQGGWGKKTRIKL